MLTVQSLSCRRSGHVVFRDIAFTAKPGDFVLVTGANGSGKSSLLRVLAALLVPASGNLLWNTLDIEGDKAAHRGRLHYIGHLDAVKPELTVCEMLDYWRALRGAEKADLSKCLDAFALNKLALRQGRSLSAGQKRRLSLTRLMMDEAPLWLLDEPTTALDKDGQKLLWQQIIRHRSQGGIVIAAMHEEPDMPGMTRVVMEGVG